MAKTPNLGRAGLGWPCANCGEQVNKTVAWLKQNIRYTCPSCGVTTEIPPDRRKRYLAALEHVDETLAILSGEKVPPKKIN